MWEPLYRLFFGLASRLRRKKHVSSSYLRLRCQLYVLPRPGAPFCGDLLLLMIVGGRQRNAFLHLGY
jgi:hypothetical protein